MIINNVTKIQAFSMKNKEWESSQTKKNEPPQLYNYRLCVTFHEVAVSRLLVVLSSFFFFFYMFVLSKIIKNKP